jgi:hypothetical protein
VGIGSEMIYCDRGIVGDTHLPPQYNEFHALDVTISYLSDWFGRRGIVSQIVHGDEGSGFDVRYRTPEPVRSPIGDEALILGMAAKSSESSHTLSITEEAHFFINPLPRLTAEQLHGVYVRPLQDLLSFATDTPNAVEDVEIRGEKVVQGEVAWNRKYHLLYNPIFHLKRKKDRLTSDNMLFTFDEAQAAVPNIFERWFDFERRHEAFCTVYFASLYAPPKFLDEKFLRLMSAFTLLTTSLHGVSQRATHLLDGVNTLSDSLFTAEERALLGHIIPTGPEIEMPFHLLRLLEDHRTLMSQIIGDDLSGFVRAVSDTMAFVERRTAADNHSPIQGEDQHYATAKIGMLIKVVVLKELGFGEEKVSKLIGRNRQFIHIKGL